MMPAHLRKSTPDQAILVAASEDRRRFESVRAGGDALFLFAPTIARLIFVSSLLLGALAHTKSVAAETEAGRVRIIIETDAGGDPDDEQSMVRFLLYANDFDVEGIICNRPLAIDGENRNSVRTGLGIIQRQVDAYRDCHSSLVKHDPRYPSPDLLRQRTVSGDQDSDAGEELVLKAVDSSDPRPVWFCNWGTNQGSAPSSLKRALDRVLRERGQQGYSQFKQRILLSSDDQFGDHITREPAFPLWIDTFRPELDRRRWYHRFSALTATAGGFDLQRDVRTGHGPLGALYPTNTTHVQKEGDTMTFLYLVPTGMNNPTQPTWGSWGGRYGLNPQFPGKPYYFANLADKWSEKSNPPSDETTHRDNTVKRWAQALQNDFRARLDYCVQPYEKANHPPAVALRASAATASTAISPSDQGILTLVAAPGPVTLSASGSTDPDGHPLNFQWISYPEAGDYPQQVKFSGDRSEQTTAEIPADAAGHSIHVVLAATDAGDPPLTRYRRLVISVPK